jgi:outer membrane lipoprotein
MTRHLYRTRHLHRTRRLHRIRPAALALLVVLGACAYPISSEYRRLADPNLKFADVFKDPKSYQGKVVIWGGIVLGTTNRSGSSEMSVLQTPLDFSGFPGDPQYSQGRFLVRSKDFLDPALYGRGRKVTVAGEITGAQSRPVGEGSITYPVVSAGEVHLRSRPPLRHYDWGWQAGFSPVYPPAYRPYLDTRYYDPFYEYGYHGGIREPFYYGLPDERNPRGLDSNLR